GGRDVRHEVERAQEGVAEPDAVEVIGDDEGEAEADRHPDGQVLEGVAHDGPERRVGGQAPVVGEADEPALADDVPVGERHEERLGRRVEADADVEGDRQGEEHPRAEAPPGAEGQPDRRRPAGPAPDHLAKKASSSFCSSAAAWATDSATGWPLRATRSTRSMNTLRWAV